ncbi:zinc-ribbon domain-containing protein [Sphingobium boeckii]|uniref:Zinc-ribbon domain-containing protein n=1 Tax=Sphingobium boeckii TaxID=1082345 RepID=A0A7W9EFU0_9SPHN|nr:zinc ribbon domain-containing protein [Sphingobium boeckii]MBB5687617.1 hypothetical protein [Sphingobium boeckii]
MSQHYCGKCGQRLPDGARFCTACGAPVDAAPVSPITPATEIATEPAFTPAPKAAPEPAYRAAPDPVPDESGGGNRTTLIIAGAMIAILVLLIGYMVIAGRDSDEGVASNAAASAMNAAAPVVALAPEVPAHVDEFLSAQDEQVDVVGEARMRDRPTAKDTQILSVLKPNQVLSGRWVKGVDPATRWIKVDVDGKSGYVWEGNLAAHLTQADYQALDLATFDGKYPMDRVGSRTFATDPVVKRLIGDAVPRDILQRMQASPGPASPIVYGDGELLSWSCKQHDCGAQNWSVFILDGPRKFARVCYHDEEKMGDSSEWYERGKSTGRQPGGCPSEFDGI